VFWFKISYQILDSDDDAVCGIVYITLEYSSYASFQHDISIPVLFWRYTNSAYIKMQNICLFVLLLLAIVLSVLRFTASYYSFWYLQTFTCILVGQCLPQKLIPRNTFVLILCYPIYHIYWNVHYNFWEIKMRLRSCFFEKCRAEISYNTMAKSKRTKRQITICKPLHIQLKIRQYEPRKKPDALEVLSF
jgi:hypothetical protein